MISCISMINVIVATIIMNFVIVITVSLLSSSPLLSLSLLCVLVNVSGFGKFVVVVVGNGILMNVSGFGVVVGPIEDS